MRYLFILLAAMFTAVSGLSQVQIIDDGVSTDIGQSITSSQTNAWQQSANWVETNSTNLATTAYVNAATTGLVTASVTNGVAVIAEHNEFMASNTFAGEAVFNSDVFARQYLYLGPDANPAYLYEDQGYLRIDGIVPIVVVSSAPDSPYVLMNYTQTIDYVALATTGMMTNGGTATGPLNMGDYPLTNVNSVIYSSAGGVTNAREYFVVDTWNGTNTVFKETSFDVGAVTITNRVPYYFLP